MKNIDNGLKTVIAEAIANTDPNTLYYYDRKTSLVVKQSRQDEIQICASNDLIMIEPMLKDLLELMEDFALEQSCESVQESLLKVLKHRDKQTAINNFKRVINDYSRSYKLWLTTERKWLENKVTEFIDDYS